MRRFLTVATHHRRHLSFIGFSPFPHNFGEDMEAQLDALSPPPPVKKNVSSSPSPSSSSVKSNDWHASQQSMDELTEELARVFGVAGVGLTEIGLPESYAADQLIRHATTNENNINNGNNNNNSLLHHLQQQQYQQPPSQNKAFDSQSTFTPTGIRYAVRPPISSSKTSPPSPPISNNSNSAVNGRKFEMDEDDEDEEYYNIMANPALQQEILRHHLDNIPHQHERLEQQQGEEIEKLQKQLQQQQQQQKQQPISSPTSMKKTSHSHPEIALAAAVSPSSSFLSEHEEEETAISIARCLLAKFHPLGSKAFLLRRINRLKAENKISSSEEIKWQQQVLMGSESILALHCSFVDDQAFVEGVRNM